MSITKKLIQISAVGIIFTTGASLSAFADCGSCQTSSEASNLTIAKVIDCAQKKGLKNIKSVECENGVWEVTTQAGNVETEYKVDPKTCDFVKVSQEKENDPDAPADCSKLNSAAKTAKSSSSKVTSVEYDDSGNIEVNAVDNKGQKHELNVSSDGSKVISKKLDN